MSSTPSATQNKKPPRQAEPEIAKRGAVNSETLVREAFDDIALLVGGAAAIHQLEDDLVWTVMKRLDRIRVRLLRNLKGSSHCDAFEPHAIQPPRVHAAVEEFLSRNHAGMGE